MLPFILVNGKSITENEPGISPLDRGFTRADGIFETMRAYGGKLFGLEEHLARLAHGASILRMDVPPSLNVQLEQALVAVKQKGYSDFAVRITLTRGPSASVALAPSKDTVPTVAISINSIPAPLGRGLRIRLAEGRRNIYSVTAGVKTLAYTDSIIELARAQEDGFDDVVFLDTDGNVSEGTTSNIFIVKDGSLITPSKDCAILMGITRKVTLEIARNLGLDVVERKISPTELESADEIFLTSSVREVAWVAQFGNRSLGDGTTGSVTSKITDSYAVTVRS